MKGPHFFEKRKKEMARQEKLKQKAERKAQRKAEKGKGEGEGGDAGDDSDEFGDVEGVNAGLQGDGEGESSAGPVEEGHIPDGQTQAERAPAGSDSEGQIRGT